MSRSEVVEKGPGRALPREVARGCLQIILCSCRKTLGTCQGLFDPEEGMILAIERSDRLDVPMDYREQNFADLNRLIF